MSDRKWMDDTDGEHKAYWLQHVMAGKLAKSLATQTWYTCPCCQREFPAPIDVDPIFCRLCVQPIIGKTDE